jgi:hypothetical protein
MGIAFDISRSVTSDSHGALAGSGVPADAYAFMVNPEVPSACDDMPDPSDIEAFDEYWGAEVTPGDMTTSRLIPSDRSRWNLMLQSKKAHYTCVQAPQTGDEGFLNTATHGMTEIQAERWNNQWYLVDTARAPQPLNSILSSINTALKEFKDRKVAGDEIGFFGFDESILPSRASLVDTWDGSNGDTYTVGLINPAKQGVQIEKLIDATEIGTSIDTRLQNMFLIPRGIGGRVEVGETYPTNRLTLSTGTYFRRAYQTAMMMMAYGQERLGLDQQVPATCDPNNTWPKPPQIIQKSENTLYFITDLKNTCSSVNTTEYCGCPGASCTTTYDGSTVSCIGLPHRHGHSYRGWQQNLCGTSTWSFGPFECFTGSINPYGYADEKHTWISIFEAMIFTPAQFTAFPMIDVSLVLTRSHQITGSYQSFNHKLYRDDLNGVSSSPRCATTKTTKKLQSTKIQDIFAKYPTSEMTVALPHWDDNPAGFAFHKSDSDWGFNSYRLGRGAGQELNGLRRPCTPPAGMSEAQCKAGALMDLIDSEICAKASCLAGSSTFCSVYAAAENTRLGELVGPGNHTYSNYPTYGTTPAGKTLHLFCDPYCRSKEEQLQNLVLESLKSNPYTLVESR